ncbi:hypothetical protein POTOM_016540 [Populus tomentosa]|uniref:Uncharacterized protein n=1 Tax=Populus tomentosa TaxID=118781 RepID=A0A8X8D3X8_POPTO|nr:hypothetical protein POTOM_016540 [Populus tomentosa]
MRCVPDDDAERKDSSGEEDRYKGMLDVDQEDEDGDKARDSKLPQMLKVFVDFFFMIIQKISSGMLSMKISINLIRVPVNSVLSLVRATLSSICKRR